eukprot:Rhum_TRINITY_DN23215_c0_g1::Rhum_TRINITY_DN23215_c0_g1_i1::g.177462::m.177462
MGSDDERAPLVGQVNVEGGSARVPRSSTNFDEGRWKDLRTSPESWTTTTPQLHAGRGGRPLVVLIPWAGALPSQVAEVVYFWQDQGCAVLRLSPSSWHLFRCGGDLDKEIDLFYQHLRTYYMPNRGFLVHAMSSLGSQVLGKLMDADHKSQRDLFAFCRGVVFDSGPHLTSPEQLRKQGRLDAAYLSESAGVLTAAGKNLPLAPVVDLLWTPIYLLILIYTCVMQYTARLAQAEAIYERLTVGLGHMRVLCLYSELDEYTDPQDVLAYKKAASQFTKVKSVLTDTAHCQHVVDAPEVARFALREFLHKADSDM